ncbi:3-hydroxybutyryl-CoA dehydrogenase [Propioniferax innocua]|uniref:3-hydroxybutyryl-CoA dehydrogenase n=1 Tax=Propioniferax innocua TaxID=1753 RepID=A0A542ZPK3_9ACTN|nr:3-hydroxybutyryl-CoA dehydrogenase [Propioniferax innocua]
MGTLHDVLLPRTLGAVTATQKTHQNISNVAVIGLGTMGAGIVEVFARAGLDVIGIEYNDQALERGRGIITKSTDRALAKNKITEAERDALLGHITWSTDRSDVSGADLVVEAVNENLDLKREIFRDIDAMTSEHAILATNTSSLSVTQIAAATQNPERVIGLHFFNPAPVQKLVEIIRTVHTDASRTEAVAHLLASCGKTPIVCGDRAGFVVNALLIPYLASAIRHYDEGFATREQLDEAMVEVGNPMGPLTLSDLIGNDVILAVCEYMYDETKNPLHAPAPLLRQMCAAGLMGRKSGRGFYDYVEGADHGPLIAEPPVTRHDELAGRLTAEYLNEVLRMVQTNYARPDDIDTGMSLGCRMPKPFDLLAEIGPVEVLRRQEKLYAETAQPAHRPVLLLEQLAQADDPQAALTELRAR